MDMNNRNVRYAGFALLLLLVEFYVIYSAYNQVHIAAHLFFCTLFAPLITWLHISKPLGRRSIDCKMQPIFRLAYGLSIFGVIITLIRADMIGQWLGSFALVPVNTLLMVACIVEPAANSKLQ